tara:strand:+ start:2282 stop:2485 length:204 start_codon:yes stop_codon:yes gene_type:complete
MIGRFHPKQTEERLPLYLESDRSGPHTLDSEDTPRTRLHRPKPPNIRKQIIEIALIFGTPDDTATPD